MSKLLAIKPSQAKKEKRLKMFMFGNAGCGKTTAALQFPKPYFIDTEKGAENDQYLELLEEQGGVIYQTNDFSDILDQVKALLKENHEFRTLVIDPITTIYNDLLLVCEKKVGSTMGRHYGEANKQMKNLINLILRLDMNVIITAHSKNEYGPNLAVLGQTFDGYKKLDYIFDLVIEIIKDKGTLKRSGQVVKTRLKNFKELEVFDWSFKEIKSRYSSSILNKDSTPQQLANSEQVIELENLIKILNIPVTLQEKWLKAANASSFYEMEEESIKKCINYLNEKNEVDNFSKENILQLK